MTGRSTVDVVVIGAGIVGLATARAVQDARPGTRIVVVDKEPVLARHQTGSNSGVVHSGLYYRPGSLKAALTVAGKVELERFCTERGVAWERCGKVVVATRPTELDALRTLAARAEANGVAAERIPLGRLRELEPYVDGIDALHVPGTGIVDYPGVCRALADDLTAGGAELRLATTVTGGEERPGVVVVRTDRDDVEAAVVVNCAGLQADRLAAAWPGATTGVRIMPFRGEYHELVPARRDLVRNLIYPVPDPRFPFLGVHFTRRVDGTVEAGPNAVPAFAREGYRWRDVDLRDAAEIVRSHSSHVLARRYWRTGFGEIHRSASRRAFVRALQRLVPDVRPDDLRRAGAGVRAQAIDATGNLLDDFAFAETPRAVHVVNAPSPAATASLAIGRSIAARVVTRLD